jgi:hypothetical protein
VTDQVPQPISNFYPLAFYIYTCFQSRFHFPYTVKPVYNRIPWKFKHLSLSVLRIQLPQSVLVPLCHVLLSFFSSPPCPDQFWGPTSLLPNGYRGLFSWE